jgi:hypothetical protein
MVAEVGAQIAGFILQERLGGVSPDVAVFRAMAARGGESAVLKIPLQQSDNAQSRFLAMARPRAGLPPHRHVVRTQQVGIDGGAAYLVQEFIPGPTFANLPLEMNLWERVRCGLEAAQALEFLHSIGVAHGGSIEAKHFRLDAESRVKLVDLGNAYAGGLPPLPEPGRERQRAAEAEVLADVMAYGAILRDLLNQGMADSVTLRSIVDHCLEQNPARRAPNLKIVIERLQAWVDSYPASRFEKTTEDAKAPASPMTHKLPRSPQKSTLFESTWTFGVLALSLVAVAGGTFESITGELLDRPSGMETMVRLPSGLLADRQKVTQGEYALFAHRNGRRLPEAGPGSQSKPAVWITAYDAAEYCEWSGKHLPSNSEWMQIRQANDPRIEHLGDDGVGEWVSDRKSPDLFAVRGFPAVIYPPARSGEDWRHIQGSSSAVRSIAPARYAAADVGFRCVASWR